MLPCSLQSQLCRSWFLLWICINGVIFFPTPTSAGVTSARIQCQYSFLGTTNLVRDPSCTLQTLSATQPPTPPPPTIPATSPLTTGPLTGAPTASNPWSFTPGWTFNPIFSCCSFTAPSNIDNQTTSDPTLITSADLTEQGPLIDQGQQQLELSVSYYTAEAPPSLTVAPPAAIFRVLLQFLDEHGAFMSIDGGSTGLFEEANPVGTESLLYYAFDVVTLAPIRIPVGARGVVLQIIVPVTQASFCFDYFALRVLPGSYLPSIEGLLQKALIGVGSVIVLNAILIPLVLFYGLPGWLWRSAPVNFFQKNPVVDHYVPLALFISTCQWIYNILLQYLGGSSSKTSVMQQPRQRNHAKPRRWRAPLLGLWAALCLIIARVGIVGLVLVQGGYWSNPIGILLAAPETIAMLSVIVFFLKTMWQQWRTDRANKSISTKGIMGGTGVDGGGDSNGGGKKGADISRSSSTARLWVPSSGSSTVPATIPESPWDDFFNISSFYHRAYVKSLLTAERDFREAAGSMYGQSTIGSDKNVYQYLNPMATQGTEPGSRYAGSTLNTTISLASSSGTQYTRHPTEYDFNVQQDPKRLSPMSPSGGQEPGRLHFPFRKQTQATPGRNGAPSEKSTNAPSSSSSSSAAPKRPPMSRSKASTQRDGINSNKLTWNSATTSYTTTSAAQPMTGAAPTPSTWEYVVYPKRHIWPTIQGTYLLIARLPLRILVAVLTTMVLCYDVLLSIGAAETVLAVPVSCLLGSLAYPGRSQFDNTMNVARAMHTVNLVLVVVLLPAVVIITVLHQVRMVQKYNWCLRLLRIGNYGFVPGGREYTQHLKHPIRFIGYTVGFGVVGLCFTIFLLFTLCTVVAMLLVAATFRSSLFRTLGSRALAAFGISCLLVLVLWLVQMLVIRYRFQMPGSRFLLSHQQSTRAGFHHWEFFWAFFNIVFGAFSFCKRIVLSILSMGIYSTRIDLCIMGGRFRPWDGGYSAFVGLVLADHTLNNPIVLEFVQILRDLLLIRRHPNLAHYYLGASGRADPMSNLAGGRAGKGNDRDRRLSMMMMLSPQSPPRGGGGFKNRALADIEEGEEARMDELLMSNPSSFDDQGAGIAVKGGVAIVPEVSRIHHYFRQDPRVDRRGQDPTNIASSSSSSSSPPPAYNNNAAAAAVAKKNNRVSKVYTPLLATPTPELNMGHAVKIQEPHQDPESAVSAEQIRQKMSEAKLRSIRVRNRWFLYVTLVRNPSIRSLRRTRAEDYLHPIGHGNEFLGTHEEEALADVQWDR
ncbi:retinol binding protein receptor-domain-containing protein [Linnemannia elongata]|nr:retinol binding protein receptor-domain-containing protein [Linnemannia elongata]